MYPQVSTLGSTPKYIHDIDIHKAVLEGPETEAFRPTFPAVNQEEDIDDSDEPIAEIERRVDDDNNTDYTTDDDYLSKYLLSTSQGKHVGLPMSR